MSCCSIETVDKVSEVPNEARSAAARLFPKDLVALVASGFIAGNSTLFALAVNVSDASETLRLTIQTGLLIASLAVITLLGPPLIKGIADSMRRRELTIDALFLLGCAGAMGTSLISYLQREGPVYFEVVSILLVIRAIGSRIKQSSKQQVISGLGALSPQGIQCRVIDADGSMCLRKIAEVRPGDQVQVPVGNMIPVDGEVISGRAFVRESVITGEPHLRSCRVGDQVSAMSIVVDCPLRIKSTSRGDERKVDGIASAVDLALKTPSRWQSQANRIARSFIPVVATLAAASFAVWTFLDSASTGILVALSVLLVACPCAFGFATPVAIWVTLSRLTTRGLIVKRADVVERLAEIDTAVFDKTGTLTVAAPNLADLIFRPGQSLSRDDIVTLVRSLQASSSHPIASAFINANDTKILPVDGFEILPGVGIRGQLRLDGILREIEVGRLEDLHRPCCDREWMTGIFENRPPHWQPIAVRVDRELVAIALIDEAKIDTLEDGLRRINALGVQCVLLSGDSDERVKCLGIARAQGKLTPQDKLDRVKQLQSEGRKVLFVGDGVNDAAAMTQADVSIAVAGGANIAQAVSDVNWHGHDLRSIADAIEVSRRTTARLIQTLIFAAMYNSLGMTLAALGLLHPVFAVVLMMGSSLFVVLRASDDGWSKTEPIPSLEPETQQLKDSVPAAPAAVMLTG